MGIVRKLLQPFYTAWVLTTFSLSLLIAFPFFLIISTGNNIRARRAIYYIIRYWAKGWLWLVGMPLSISGPKPSRGRYVYVANHTSYLDSVLVFPAVPYYFRALGKIEMSKIPVLGFVYRQIVVMVNRDSAHSRALSMRIMYRVLKRESGIIIFPEGTFNETEPVLKSFYDGAFRLAINTQTPIIPIIFPDALHRWHYSRWWKLWPGRNRAIYLQRVDVTGTSMHDLPILKQKIYYMMEAELRKYR